MLQIVVFCFTLGLGWGMEGGCPAKPGKVWHIHDISLKGKVGF